LEAWQTAGLNALNNREQWPERLLEAAAQRLGLANGRLERP